MLTEHAHAVPGPSFEAVNFLGLDITLLTSNGLLDLVSDTIRESRKIVVAHHNLHSLSLHSGSSPSLDGDSFRRFYEEADYTLADGMSLVALGKLCRQKIDRQHRVAYNDWLPHMLPEAVRQGWRLFYLGSTTEVAAKGAQILTTRFPGLQLRTHDGHFEVQRNGASNKEVLTAIAQYRPHILFVGMGMPRQELWIEENRDDIAANVILSSGATLDYVAGAKRMAPRWMGSLGLEWAFRLATEPRRLGYRYLVEPWTVVSLLVANLQTSRNNSSHRSHPSEQEIS